MSKGLKIGDIVIANPDKNIKESEKLEDVKSTDAKSSKGSKEKSKESGVNK